MSAAAAEDAKYAQVYTSKVGKKDWIAYAFTPEQKDIDEAVLRLKSAYPNLEIKLQSEDKEGHHITLYWGLEEKDFPAVKKMVEHAQVPKFEVLRASDDRAVVALHEADDKSCVFAVLDMAPNVPFELTRAMVGGHFRTKKSTYKHHNPHCTIAVGKPIDPKATINNKRKLTRVD